MRDKIIVGALGFGLWGLMGCSSAPAPQPMSAPIESAQAMRNVPFGLKVVDEINDGQRLHILASVESRTTWDPRRVMVRLTGLNGDKILGVNDYPLVGSNNPTVPTVLEPGRPFDVSLSIPIAGVTDYQLELLWGEESGVELKGSAPSPLQLKNVTVAKSGARCADEKCPVVFEVSGDLTNFGTGTIARAALGVGFLPHGQGFGAIAGIPADEEVIDLASLALEPGKSRPIKLAVEQPELVGGSELTPVVRIVSFEAAEPSAPSTPTHAG